MAGKARTLSRIYPYMLRTHPPPPPPRAGGCVLCTQASAASWSPLVFPFPCFGAIWNRLRVAPQPGTGAHRHDRCFISPMYRLSCCTTLQTAQYHFTTKSQRRPKPSLGARKGAHDAHDALLPRLHTASRNTRNTPCLAGSLVRAASKVGVPPMPSHSSWKGNIGSGDARPRRSAARKLESPIRTSTNFFTTSGLGFG